MRASFTIGRFAGIPVGVNWSVLIIFGVITYGLAVNRFPAVAPGKPGWAYGLAGFSAALVFLGGLLAHELSHAIVARRNGVGVSSITLWLFGGVAQLEDEARAPGPELRIAGIGPLVSLVLAVFFAGIAVLVGLASGGGLLLHVLIWLALINLALAVFNVIPAAPLDGGRLLRAALWRIRGDWVWAARASARVGQGFGLLLVGFGFWLVFGRDGGFSGIWLAVVGWFIFGAAGAEHRQAQEEQPGAPAHRGSGIRVREVMSGDPIIAPAELTINQFLGSYLFTDRITAFPLIDAEGRSAGLVTTSTLSSVPAEARDTTTLREIARAPETVPTATPDESLRTLLSRMDGAADGRALVWQGGFLAGIVTPSDIRHATGETDGRAPSSTGSNQAPS